MPDSKNNNSSVGAFDVAAYLATTGPGRRIIHAARGQEFFAQGDPADSVLYMQRGRARVSVLSPGGKEATIRLIATGDFFGEKAMEPVPALRVTRATATSECTVLRITRDEFLRVMRREASFSHLFSAFLLECTLKTQAALVDQMFNRAEKRLARLLLVLAESAGAEEDDALLPPISQEALANMIRSTRPRVNEFMNRFRKLGFIEYDHRIRVHRSLLNVFLRD